MQRLKRRNRPYQELKTKSSGGILDVFDNTIKEIFFIDDN